MRDYLELVNDILLHGENRPDRTGTGVLSLFGRQLKFDLRDGFPIVTTKRVPFRSVVGELLWFLSGSTSAKELREKYGCTIWDEWEGNGVEGDGIGDLGPVYGAQWRCWPHHGRIEPRRHGIDQIATLIENIRRDPYSRRHVVSAWNVADLDQMALAPCHALFQIYVSPATQEMDLHLYQRSADVFLGVPFNIASYALLLALIGQVTGHRARHLYISFGDVHLYHNHLEQAKEMLSRAPKLPPILSVNPEIDDIFAFTVDDIALNGYWSHPPIAAPVAV
jgi:thymidylate synthase